MDAFVVELEIGDDNLILKLGLFDKIESCIDLINENLEKEFGEKFINFYVHVNDIQIQTNFNHMFIITYMKMNVPMRNIESMDMISIFEDDLEQNIEKYKNILQLENKDIQGFNMSQR